MASCQLRSRPDWSTAEVTVCPVVVTSHRVHYERINVTAVCQRRCRTLLVLCAQLPTGNRINQRQRNTECSPALTSYMLFPVHFFLWSETSVGYPAKKCKMFCTSLAMQWRLEIIAQQENIDTNVVIKRDALLGSR